MTGHISKKQIGLINRSANIDPKSINRDARTVDVVWSRGAQVMRTDWWSGDQWTESLSLDPAHVRLDRLNAGANLVDTHDTSTIRSILGVVVPGSAVVDGKEGRATIQFSKRAEIDPIFQDVADGVIRNLSVGYWVYSFRETTLPNDAMRSFIAEDWEPGELTLCAVPADPGAQTRSQRAGNVVTVECQIFETRESETRAAAQKEKKAMLKKTGDNPAPGTGQDNDDLLTDRTQYPGTPHSPANNAPEGPVAATIAEVRSIVSAQGLPAEFALDLAARNLPLNHVRQAVLDELAKRQPPINGQNSVSQDHDGPEALRAAFASALAHRATAGRVKAQGRGLEFVYHSPLDMVAELAARSGKRFNRHNRAAVVDMLFTRDGGFSTSDFPNILADAANKILLPGYEAAPASFRQIAAQRSFNDFKPTKFLRIGDFPQLQNKAEFGGVKYGSISENKETVTPAEYATGISIDRRALINDDLGAFNDFAAMIGMRMAADANRLVWAVVKANPALSDSQNLFSTAHANIAGSGTAISTTSLGTAKSGMKKQTSLDGLPLNISPAIICVSPDKEVEAAQALTAVLATQSSNVNVFAGKLDLVSEANLTGNAWYLFASPAMAPVVVWGYVAGAEGPQVTSEIDFDTKALKINVGLDLGAGIIDFRGAYYNAGN
jgi:phage major head subunit gpT-like protein